MIVNRRSDNNAGPATLSVYLSKADASSADAPPPGPSTFPASFVSSTTNTTPAPPPLPHETVTRIDMKHQVPEAILAEFLKVTNAKVLEPTADETAQLEALAIRHERAAEDRRKMLEYTERQRRERMLRFRGAAASSS